MLKYLILFFVSLVFSFLLTPLVRSFATKIKAIDLPGGRKVHTRPIPRLGGVAIFIVFHVVLLVSSQFGIFHFPPGFLQEIRLGWILLASAIVLGVGSVDDIRRMPPSIKFLFQIIAGLIVALTCRKIETIFLPFGTFHLGPWAVPATVFWILAITNAVNLLDGLDGLAAGISFIVCIAIFSMSLLGQNIGVALISIILAGSTLGFLKYNFHPASIFLGDSGSYFLGFIISILSLMSSQKGPAAVAVLVPIIALGIPIMDTAFSMLRRLLKSLHIMEVDKERNLIRFLYFQGWSMFKADKDHFHHRLLQAGFTQKKAVMFLYAISIVLGALALSCVYVKNVNQALLLSTIGIASYIGIRKLGYSEVQVLSNGTLLPFFNTPVINRRLLRVFVDMGLISFSYYLAFLLRFEGAFPSYIKHYYLLTLPLILATKITAFYFTGLYGGAWRYAGVSDVMTMIKAVVLGCAASTVLLRFIPDFGILSRAVLLIDFNLLLLFVVGARSSFRFLEQFHLAKNHKGRRVIIFGAGKRGVYAVKEFISNPRLDLSPVGFIDENPRYQGKRIIGFPVLGNFDSLEGILAKNSISEVILCREDLSKEKIKRLAEICSAYNIPLRHYRTRLEEITMPIKDKL